MCFSLMKHLVVAGGAARGPCQVIRGQTWIVGSRVVFFCFFFFSFFLDFFSCCRAAQERVSSTVSGHSCRRNRPSFRGPNRCEERCREGDEDSFQAAARGRKKRGNLLR